MEKLFGQPVFSVGDIEYNWEDVVLAAKIQGNWAELENELRQGLACIKCLEAKSVSIPVSEVTAAANEFRYKRGLITAEETEIWLKLWRLTIDQWMGYVRRSLLRKKWADRLNEIASEYLVTDDEIRSEIRSEAICSGCLGEFARNLAGKAAACEQLNEVSGHTINQERIISHLESLSKKVDSNDLESLTRRPPERLVHLATLEAGFEEIAARVITPEAVKRCVAANRIDWIKLVFDEIGFTDEHQAREGALCVREDGMSMAEVAADAQRTVRRTTVYIEDLGPKLKSEFLACAEGELLGPLRWEGQHSLCLVVDKIMPDEAEPQIRQKAAQTILDTLVKREVTDRVRWHLALE